MKRIFVQIASYRDPQLIPTIKDCIEKATYPERLTFGICHQHADDEWDTLEDFKDDSRFRIIDVPHLESKGLCWARSLIQKLWKGEEYTLQLDSHHRFLENWDVILIDMLESLDSKKPILSSYAHPFSPDDSILDPAPYKMVADTFTPTGTILFRPHVIPNWQELETPIPARFVSGHFFFTIGKHCDEYKYDPNVYFAGDEISLSIRSFTLGYDLFHPHRNVIWHEYTREGRTKHWTDFSRENKEKKIVEKDWHELDAESKRRLRHMLREEFHEDIDLGEYGLGDVRSHSDYELYAGINFKERALHPDTTDGKDPPVNDTSEWYTKTFTKYISILDFDIIGEYTDIYVGIEDKAGNVIYQKYYDDLPEELVVEYTTYRTPYKWVIWPRMNNQWLNRTDVEI